MKNYKIKAYSILETLIILAISLILIKVFFEIAMPYIEIMRETKGENCLSDLKNIMQKLKT